jgi:cytochrome b561
LQLVEDPAERFDLTQTHKTIGVVVLALTVLRLCLRVLATAPQREHAPLLAAKAMHAGLYTLLLLLPLSGWLMATTTPVRVPTVVFGLFALPYPLAPDLAMYRLAHAVHVTAAIALAALVLLHALTVSATGFVTPSKVRLPMTRAVRASSFSTCVEVKLSVGNRVTSRRAALLTKSLKVFDPSSTESESTVKLVKLFAGWSKSRRMRPSWRVKRPRVAGKPTASILKPIAVRSASIRQLWAETAACTVRPAASASVTAASSAQDDPVRAMPRGRGRTAKP